MAFSPDYLETLKQRKAQSRVYKPFQLHGLELSTILKDPAHKALYIRLAKDYDVQRLRELAKDVAERKNIKQPGAYFMAILMQDKKQYGYKKPERIKKPVAPNKASRGGLKTLETNGRTNTTARKPRGRKSPSRSNKTV